ncbi:MAG: TolC family protein [Pirellulaceae bacterium]|nr:TolC family protein [Pirellulaceae bacterium]
MSHSQLTTLLGLALAGLCPALALAQGLPPGPSSRRFGPMPTQGQPQVPTPAARPESRATFVAHQPPAPPPPAPSDAVPQRLPPAQPTQPAPPTDPAESAEPIGFFTLSDLSALANQENPLLYRSESEIEAAMGERVQAALYPNPRFETNNPEIWAGKDAFVNFGFQQDLVTKGKIRILKAAADQSVRSERAGYNIDRAQMLTQVRMQYIDALAAKQRVLLAQYIAGVSGRSRDVAKQLQQAGEGNLTDVLLLESEYQLALAELDQARSLLAGEYRQLSAVVGIPQLEIREIDGSLFQSPPELDEARVTYFVSNDSSFMERMRAELIRSQVLLRKEEADAYPNLRFGPAFQSGTSSGTAQFWLSIVFDIPVWDLNQGNIRRANARVGYATADMEVVRNELIRQTAEKFARYRAAKQVAARIQDPILPNAQRALSLVQDGFAKGQFDVNRVLQAQRNMSEVAREHIEASEKAWTSAAELAGLSQIEYFPLGSPPKP